MLKRKLYWVAIGLAASHLSLAEFWNSGKSRRFGDCADCNVPVQIDLPVPGSKMANITGFTHGNGVRAVPNVSTYAAEQAKQYQQLVQQPPFVEQPKPAQLFDLRLYNEILGLRPADRLDLFQRGSGGMFNWSPAPMAPPSAPYFSPQGAYGSWGVSGPGYWSI